MAELTDKARIEQIESTLVYLLHRLRGNMNVPTYMQMAAIIEGAQSTAPEPTAFRKHMAEDHPDFVLGSLRWVDRRKGWNAAVDAAAKRCVGCGSCQSDRLVLALKEPEA